MVPSLRRAGAERQAVDLANGLVERGHHITLCTLDPDLSQRDELAPSIKVHAFARKAKIDLRPIFEIAKVIDQERVEVVQGIMQFAALYGFLAALRSRTKPPVLSAIHTTTNVGLKEEIHDRYLYRHLHRRLPAVVFVCDFQRNYWVTKFPELETKAEVVHNGIDVSRFQRTRFIDAGAEVRERLGIPRHEFVFTCVAGFRREKGHDILIEAFSQMPLNTHLLLAGDGVQRLQIERAVRTASLQQRVHLLGTVADVRPVIAASDVTVLASTSVETFSIAMLESMAMQVPVIATDIGGLREAIIPGETGLLAIPGDVASLREQMWHALVQRPQLALMGRAGSEMVSARFTLERMTQSNEAILYAAIKRQLS